MASVAEKFNVFITLKLLWIEVAIALHCRTLLFIVTITVCIVGVVRQGQLLCS